MKKAEIKMLRSNKWQIEKELVLKEGKVYILKDKELRKEIIQLHHDILEVEHRGRQNMMELATRNYWWLRVQRKQRDIWIVVIYARE